MLVKQAAKKSGLSKAQVTNLIRDNKLKATKVPNPFVRHGYHYEITEEDLKEMLNTPRPSGFPRGEKRTGERGEKLKETDNAPTSKEKKDNTKTVSGKNKTRKAKRKESV